MPYDPTLAGRIESILAYEEGITSKKMFGGICFMLHGNMLCGVVKDRLVLRVGPDLYESFLEEEQIRPFDFTGKPLRGFVYVLPKGVQTDQELQQWISRVLAFVKTLDHK